MPARSPGAVPALARSATSVSPTWCPAPTAWWGLTRMIVSAIIASTPTNYRSTFSPTATMLSTAPAGTASSERRLGAAAAPGWLGSSVPATAAWDAWQTTSLVGKSTLFPTAIIASVCRFMTTNKRIKVPPPGAAAPPQAQARSTLATASWRATGIPGFSSFPTEITWSVRMRKMSAETLLPAQPPGSTAPLACLRGTPIAVIALWDNPMLELASGFTYWPTGTTSWAVPGITTMPAGLPGATRTVRLWATSQRATAFMAQSPLTGRFPQSPACPTGISWLSHTPPTIPEAELAVAPSAWRCS